MLVRVALSFDVHVYDADLVVDKARCLFPDLDLVEIFERVPEEDTVTALKTIFTLDQPLDGARFLNRYCEIIKP